MKVDRGFNLYVDVTAACNASCPFCIAPTVGRKDAPQFMDGVRWALEFTEKHYGSIQVTGGEPTLSRKLPEVIREISRRCFHRVVLNTNGTGISRPNLGTDLEQAGFTHVNISRHHYWDDKNQEIMRFKHPLEAATETFVKAVEIVRQSRMMVRVNCNLIAGYIDSAEKMLAFVEWCGTFGVKSVAFSETFPLGVFDHQVQIEPNFGETHAVELSGIISDIDKVLEPKRIDGGRMSVWSDGPPPSSWSGMHMTRHITAWGQSGWGGVSSTLPGHRRYWSTPQGGEISVKTLSGWNDDGSPKAPAYSKAADPEINGETVYFAVVHPDGTVSASWDKRERILFVPEKEYLFDASKLFARV